MFEYTHGALRYVRGVTGVHTSANEAYADGAGVCQDFAHLGACPDRAVGLPSRYVSGYFHPDPDAAIGEEVDGREPRLGRGVDRQVVGVRPHQRPRGG